MTVEEKREKLRVHCIGRRCSECVLYDKPVSKRYSHCLDINLATESEVDKAIEIIKGNIYRESENDPVNRPSHYTDGKIEVIEFIEDKNLGFCLGNAVKYIARAGKKDPTKEIEDLNKAKWYIERRIKELEEASVC